ncbi:MAG: hypothetical protein AAF478_03550 [Pseudomonadota bacterium]
MARKSHTKTIRALFADSLVELQESDSYDDPPPLEERDGVPPGHWYGFPFENMPPNCPIQVHGIKGNTIWITDASGQLIGLDKGDAVATTRLFGKFQNYPEYAFPRFKAGNDGLLKDTEGQPMFYTDGKTAKRIINGLEFQKLYRCLCAEGGRKGLFDPSQQHRGRGGWQDEDESFIWHNGKYLFKSSDGKALNMAKPGEHNGYLYSVQPEILSPWSETVSIDETPAISLIDDFATWNWERPFLDPVMLVGFIGTLLMGGALKWRPIIFTTGGAGVGKSTLHGIIESVLDSAVMATADTTAAGIYQNIKQDSTGVIVDEFEADSRMQRTKPVIDLARIAASGSKGYRGGAEGTGTSFTVRCSFMFSAINVPKLEAADKSRMAILNLGSLAAKGMKTREFVYRADQGRQLLRQIMDGWKRYQNEILPDWMDQLSAAGFNQRQIDTYGTLLAAAELLVGPEKLEEIGLPVTDGVALGEVVAAATRHERQIQKPNWLECLEFMLDSPIESYNSGTRPTVGGVLADLQDIEHTADFDIKHVREKLSVAGLGLRDKGKVPDAKGYVLCVPTEHVQLDKLFQNSKYAGGVWHSALKQCEHPFIIKNVSDRPGLTNNSFKQRFAVQTKHCVLVDLQMFQEWQQNEE